MTDQLSQDELHLAYVWDCDNCGAENFERAVIAELSPEDAAEMRAEGLDPTTGNWMTRPEEVTCRSCGRHYDVSRESEDE